MKVVILAAGEGRRMLPLTATIPKPLLLINDKPVIQYIFEALPESVEHIYIVVKYLGDQIKKFVDATYPEKNITFVEGSDRGTAYSLKAVEQYIDPDESFMVIYGDDLPTREEVKQCLAFKHCVLVCQSAEPESCGIVELNSEGNICHIVEKPQNPTSCSAVGGIMVVTDYIFKCEPEPSLINGEFYLTSMCNKYLKKFPLRPVYTGPCRQFSSPNDIQAIEKLLTDRI